MFFSEFGLATAGVSTLSFYQDMKKSTLPTLIILLASYAYAEPEKVSREQPIFFAITPAAYERFAKMHESTRSVRLRISAARPDPNPSSGNHDDKAHKSEKGVYLILNDQLRAFSGDSNSYTITLKNLDFESYETPPQGTVPIAIRGLKCQASPELVELLKRSTIDLIHITGTFGVSEMPALILRPSDPIISTPIKRE